MNFNSVRSFKWEFLHSIEYQNEIAFNAFYKIIQNQENAYSLNDTELKGVIEGDEVLNSLPQNHYGGYLRANYDIDIQALEDVKRFQRYSSCILLFSFFEEKLKAICKLVETEHGLRKIEKSTSSLIELYWDYLTDVYGIDETIKKYLEPIKEQRFVRNKIVHQGGFFSETQHKCFNPASGVRLEKYNNEYQIIITDTIYLTDITEKMNVFLKHLLIEVDKRFSKVK